MLFGGSSANHLFSRGGHHSNRPNDIRQKVTLSYARICNTKATRGQGQTVSGTCWQLGSGRACVSEAAVKKRWAVDHGSWTWPQAANTLDLVNGMS